MNLQINDRHMQMVDDARILHSKFLSVLPAKGVDSRVLSIAIIALAAQSIRDLPPELQFEMKERFLKSYIKAADAPFTIYKLGH